MATFYLSAFADEAGTALEEQIQALLDNNIRFIEPRNIGGKAILALTEAELKEVRLALDRNGIKVNSLGSPIGKYKIEDDFKTHLKDFDKALLACELLGTDKMRMFSFYVKQEELAKYRDEVIARLNEMVRLAKAHGITLCHENESEIYGQMPEEVKDLLTNVDGLYGIFDAANYRMNNGDVMDGIEATLLNFAYLHIKDAHFASQTILPAGEGEGRVGEIIDIVNDRFDGDVYLTLEPHLFGFAAYQDIDNHELKGKYKFNSNREAFDFAANALKTLLEKHGYREVGVGVWKK